LRNDAPIATARLIEFAPFVVMVEIVALGSEITCMKRQLNAAIGVEGLPDDPLAWVRMPVRISPRYKKRKGFAPVLAVRNGIHSVRPGLLLRR
jgi:hypothetical protein